MTADCLAPPLALYVHFPWCVKKCPYCDFNSHPVNEELPEAEYLAALIADWEAQKQTAASRRIQSVFFGGGTPSLFSAGSFSKLIATLEPALADDAEITMEANPGTLEYDNFAEYRKAGINRLSMGVQSFNDRALEALGRIHDASEAQTAIEAAKTAGFDNINIDLMHGLPEQTVAAALKDLHIATAAGVQHISWYQLTIEPRTEFAKRPPQLPKEDTLGDIEAEGLALLKHAGFQRYEISAYAKEGQRSRHNQNYWRFGDYLGLGAGAHGKLTTKSQTGELTITRTAHPRQPRLYLQQAAQGRWQLESNLVDQNEFASEFLMNALRLLEGVTEDSFVSYTGQPLSVLDPQLAKWRRMGVIDSERLALTPMGLNALDTVVADFLPD